jgi:hypothetical protein
MFAIMACAFIFPKHRKHQVVLGDIVSKWLADELFTMAVPGLEEVFR